MPLSHFLQAQSDPDTGFAAALEEIRTTGKRGHWIWSILPQLAGLGSSFDARRFAIADPAEAAAYLDHPVLGPRLVEISEAITARVRPSTTAHEVRLVELMNAKIDVLKFVSSLTLFKGVAERVPEADRTETHRRMILAATEILAAAEAQGFPACAFTLARLAER